MHSLRPGYHRADEDTVPEGWAVVQLSEVASTSAGGRLGYTKQDHYGAGGVPAFSAAGQDGFVERAEFRDVDGVVLSAIGANCGRTFLAKGSWTTLANTQAIIPNDRLLASYLWHRTNREDYWPRSGSAQPFIKPSSIGACWILLPPIGEQRRIAEILDTLDEAIRTTEALIAKLEQVKKGLLHDLLTRGIDDNGELRDPERHPEQFKDSPLGRIPREWSTVPLRELVVLLRNGTSAAQAGTQTSYPVSRIETISGGTIDWRRVGYLHSPDPGYLMAPGDILYSHINSIAHMGKVALFDGSRALYHGMNLMLLRVDQTRAVPGFLHAVLASDRGRAHARRECKSAINQASLKQSDIGRFLVLLPSRDEQSEITRRIESVDERLRAERNRVNKLSFLRRGLMDDLLSGRVRVSADSQEVSA